jgi:hypothetical protein
MPFGLNFQPLVMVLFNFSSFIHWLCSKTWHFHAQIQVFLSFEHLRTADLKLQSWQQCPDFGISYAVVLFTPQKTSRLLMGPEQVTWSAKLQAIWWRWWCTFPFYLATHSFTAYFKNFSLQLCDLKRTVSTTITKSDEQNNVYNFVPSFIHTATLNTITSAVLSVMLNFVCDYKATT